MERSLGDVEILVGRGRTVERLSVITVGAVLSAVTVLAIILGVTLAVPTVAILVRATDKVRDELTDGQDCGSDPCHVGSHDHSLGHGPYGRPCEENNRECCDEEKANVHV
jgi:hypothetical protein